MPISQYRRKAKMAPRRRYAKKSGSVATLARKVNTLMRAKRVAAQWLNMRQAVTNQSIAAVSSYNLMNISAMTPIFGTSTDDQDDPKVLYHSFKAQCRVTLENTVNNEESTTRFSAFLVSLKDKISSAIFNNTNGALTLTQDNHYILNQGIAYLNKKLFTIHRSKYFTLTNYNTNLANPAAQSMFGTDIEWMWSYAPKVTLENPSGNWSSLQSALDPSKQYYILIFSDNQTGDLENPEFTISQITNFKKIASSG